MAQGLLPQGTVPLAEVLPSPASPYPLEPREKREGRANP